MNPEAQTQLEGLVRTAIKTGERVTQFEAAANVAKFEASDAQLAVVKWVEAYCAEQIAAAVEAAGGSRGALLLEGDITVEGAVLAVEPVPLMLAEPVAHIGIEGTYPVDGCGCAACNDARFAARVASSGRASANVRR